jgi:DnaJ domain
MKNLFVQSFVVLLSVSTISGLDFYELLGIDRHASTREIRQAFKKLALTLHPDKNRVSHHRILVNHCVIFYNLDILKNLDHITLFHMASGI